MASTSAWAKKICVAWQNSLDAIFEVGDLLIAAKQELPHGQFEAMVQNALPFGPRTAERLMAIAADARLRNPTHVSHLPRSWGTLYELTRLDDQEVETLLGDGTITPETTRVDVQNAHVKLAIRTATATPQPLRLTIGREPPKPPQFVPAVKPNHDELSASILIQFVRHFAARVDEFEVAADLSHVVEVILRKRRDEFIEQVDTIERFVVLLKQALKPPLNVVAFTGDQQSRPVASTGPEPGG